MLLNSSNGPLRRTNFKRNRRLHWSHKKNNNVDKPKSDLFNSFIFLLQNNCRLNFRDKIKIHHIIQSNCSCSANSIIFCVLFFIHFQ